MPDSLEIVLADRIYIAKKDMPGSLGNRVIRLAAFQNPAFYKAQRLRLSVWNIPRIIVGAENLAHHVAIPRACLEMLSDLLEKNGIRQEIRDERVAGRNIGTAFRGMLRSEQETALSAMLAFDTGVLCAPTAFGKTVVAAALIARRKVSTLVLVNRTDLLRQWKESLSAFLELPADAPGLIGGGKNRQTGIVDIAVIQALVRRENVKEILDAYGQIIVDECHHISAISFAMTLRQAASRFVVGLTATPVRRDGHQPIVFMQCGPLRHSAHRPERSGLAMDVRATILRSPLVGPDSSIHDIFDALVHDAARNRRICADVLGASGEGRKILVLSERTSHIHILREMLGESAPNIFMLHGRLSRKARAATMARLEALPDSDSRILLATGKLIGEGFDHPES
jgi:superfamily II DNA or RNA helicase